LRRVRIILLCEDFFKVLYDIINENMYVISNAGNKNLIKPSNPKMGPKDLKITFTFLFITARSSMRSKNNLMMQ